jgi:transposase
MSDLFRLTDAQIARLAPFFPRSHGKPRVDDRRVLSGIIFINRNGLRWRDAPTAYGPHKTLYSRWKRWSEKGIFARMMAGLAAEASRVFRRLLFVRRSHDERYKEQVFT